MYQLASKEVNMLRFLWLLLLWPVARASATIICGSLELHEVSDFDKLRNCSIIVGHVRLANLHIPDNFDASVLATNVTEITDYLMIYRCTGLHSLEMVFPKLRLIRGKQLLFDQYSLIIYENRNLIELGFVELLRIQSGNIRIESNPILCFVQTVDWIYLLGNSTTQHFFLRSNKSPNHCPVCGGLNADYYNHTSIKRYCWNTMRDQVRLMPPQTHNCPGNCGRNGCDSSGKCCEHSCITGCSAQSCTLCANFQREGRCVDYCVPNFVLHNRQCVSNKKCRQLNLIPLTRGSRCVDQCPTNHKPITDSQGFLQCQLECKDIYHIKREADLEQLQDCVIINGSLTIELIDIKEKIISSLEQALGNIKEITGYLRILNSAQLMSLSFFKNLDTIRGDQLLENKYALSVVNNYHLENIWSANRQVAIQHGNIFFHLNPRLCYEKIQMLLSSLKEVRKISIADVSPNSNGERVICGKAVNALNPIVEDKNSTAVRIAVEIMKYNEFQMLIGYSYHYMEAPQRNVTMYDGRHGCGHDNWLMDISPSRNRRHIIKNLKPYTQYAYFVKTITHSGYHMLFDAYSNILYFRTEPSKPSPVRRVYGSSEHSTQIMVHWWPPRRPNGVISKYIVNFELRNISDPEAKTRNYITFKPSNISDLNCVCNDIEPYYSGPQPEDENYYNKEQMVYEYALPNLIYVSRTKLPAKKEKFDKVKDFNDLVTSSTFKAHESSSHLNVADNNTTLNAANNTSTLNVSVNSTTPNAANIKTALTASGNGTTVKANIKSAPVTRTVSIASINNLKRKTCSNTSSMQEASNKSSKSDNNTTLITASQTVDCTNSTKEENFVQMTDEMIQKLLTDSVEERSRSFQETGIANFPIVHRTPKCNATNASMSYQLDNNCRVEEEINGITVPGTQHYYNLTGLKPDQFYRITVRACVDGIVNGCSNTTEMVLKTISVKVDRFMNGN